MRTRILNPYVQTSLFINEAVNLDQVIVQGYISAKEKSGRRKDRVMSLVYALNLASKLEEELSKDNNFGFLDYILTA